MSTPIIVLAGQSNAARAGTRIGVGEVAAQTGALYVPFAVSGTPLAEEMDGGQGDWSASGQPGAGEHLATLFHILDTYLDPASPLYIPDAYLAGVVWIQGEADGFDATAVDQYAGNLTELRDAVVARYGAHDWVISALSETAWDTREAPNRVYENYMALRANQFALDAVAGFTVVDPDQVAIAAGVSSSDMFDPDRVHYTESFGIALGNALASKLIVAQGDVSLQIGTSAGDYFTITGDVRHEVYGSTGLNSVDFSAIGQAIVLTDNGDRFASVRNLGPQTGFSAELVEVGRVYGTNYDDVFRLGDYLRDIRAGGGNDTLFAGSISINVQMGDGDDRIYASAFNDNLIGQDGRDLIYGYDGDDRLFGGNDNDRLYGGGGNDLIEGGNGNDQIFGGVGDDAMAGGGGSDRYEVDSLGDTVAERGGEGTDTVVSSVSFTLGDHVERLNLVDGAGDLTGTGNGLSNVIFGNDGANVLTGLAGSDRLYGEEGADMIYGGQGNDRLYGGSGADLLDGGLGNDTYYVDDTGDLVIEGEGGGFDFIESDVTFVMGDNVERLRVGRNGADVDGTGNALGNGLYGGNGDNRLWGLAGNDTIQGQGGNDILYGGAGDDRLYGGAGDDLLIGGDRDHLDGGEGDDTFRLAGRNVVVHGFDPAHDSIELLLDGPKPDLTAEAGQDGVTLFDDGQVVALFPGLTELDLLHVRFVAAE